VVGLVQNDEAEAVGRDGVQLALQRLHGRHHDTGTLPARCAQRGHGRLGPLLLGRFHRLAEQLVAVDHHQGLPAKLRGQGHEGPRLAGAGRQHP
jgi:hypothetical protein